MFMIVGRAHAIVAERRISTELPARFNDLLPFGGGVAIECEQNGQRAA
jgi:hypothetical protein